VLGLNESKKIFMEPGEGATIPLFSRLPKTVQKITARFRRTAFQNAPSAFDDRMLMLSALILLFAAAISPMDEEASRWATSSNEPFVRLLARYTDIGKSTIYLLCAFAAMILISMSDWRRRGVAAKARLALVYAQASYVFAAIAVSGILVNMLKLIIGRARPKLLEIEGAYSFFSRWGIAYDFTSFPSGHATTMGALAAILALWYPKLRPLTLFACFLVALSRVAAGAHFPSDVIAGFGFGFMFSVYLARILARRSSVFLFVDSKILPKLQFSGAFSRIANSEEKSEQ
jgi:undecaprenyl-diphosphatase